MLLFGGNLDFTALLSYNKGISCPRVENNMYTYFPMEIGALCALKYLNIIEEEET